MTVMECISQGKRERMLEEDRRKAILDYNSNMAGAREEGELKGKMEVAASMLKKGLDIAFISEITGLESQQLKSLQNPDF
jgi:predicted transposase/invertase (TIGR01784 family)